MLKNTFISIYRLNDRAMMKVVNFRDMNIENRNLVNALSCSMVF